MHDNRTREKLAELAHDIRSKGIPMPFDRRYAVSDPGPRGQAQCDADRMLAIMKGNGCGDAACQRCTGVCIYGDGDAPERVETGVEKALNLIASAGGHDGAHHKQWVLDQVVRILTECPPVTKSAVDCNGLHYSYEALGESDAYREWIRQHNEGEDGPSSYEWDEGVPL